MKTQKKYCHVLFVIKSELFLISLNLLAKITSKLRKNNKWKVSAKLDKIRQQKRECQKDRKYLSDG